MKAQLKPGRLWKTRYSAGLEELGTITRFFLMLHKRMSNDFTRHFHYRGACGRVGVVSKNPNFELGSAGKGGTASVPSDSFPFFRFRGRDGER
jgi:hypothetical protein